MVLRLVLLGPPGSGKGTLAKQLEERLGLATLSTGDIFRREIKAGSRLGKRVQDFVTKGLLVPDELVVSVMTKQLTPRRLQRGIALDGFPRTVGQAEGLNRFLRSQRRPLLAYYRRQGVLHRVNGDGTSEPVYDRVLRLFRQHGWLKKE